MSQIRRIKTDNFVIIGETKLNGSENWYIYKRTSIPGFHSSEKKISYPSLMEALQTLIHNNAISKEDALKMLV